MRELVTKRREKGTPISKRMVIQPKLRTLVEEKCTQAPDPRTEHSKPPFL